MMAQEHWTMHAASLFWWFPRVNQRRKLFLLLRIKLGIEENAFSTIISGT
jgi:hypothetical protein